MSVSAHWFDKAIERQFTGTQITWTSDSIKVALLTSSWTPNRATNDVWSDISANEASGTGYTAGGVALATLTEGVTSNVLKLDADDAVWAASTITARYAAIYDVTAGNKLLGYVDFGANVTSTAAAFTITWSASGIFTITLS